MQAALEHLARALGRDISPEASAALGAYCELVRSWNERMDLTAARGNDALAEVLCADAIVLASTPFVPPEARMLDVGTGAGAPAIPLLLLRPDVRATLVEPLRKRVAFLRIAIGSLDLSDRATVLESRAEGGRAIAGQPFDVAMSRATLPPAEWLSLGRTMAPRVLVLTAQEPPPDPPEGWEATGVDYRLPSSGAARRITEYRCRIFTAPSGKR